MATKKYALKNYRTNIACFKARVRKSYQPPNREHFNPPYNYGSNKMLATALTAII